MGLTYARGLMTGKVAAEAKGLGVVGNHHRQKTLNASVTMRGP
jgi:hypothetical protein